MDASDTEEVDGLPAPRRPALAFVTCVWVASEAAQRALDEVTCGKHEDALGALRKAVAGMRPASYLDQSEDAWARRGAADGVVDAWTGTPYSQPQGCPSNEHAMVHACAWQLSQLAVMGVRCE